VDRLEAETHVAPTPGGEAACVPEFPGDSTEETELLIREVSDETKLLISRCMDGSEPLDRPLKDVEPQKFNTVHVNTVLLRAAGFRQVDIAKILSVDSARISVVCNHPYGKKIIQAMMHQQSGRVLDIKTKLDQHAATILDRMVLLASTAEDLDSVSKVGFGLLDRAGFGPKQTIEATSKNTTTVVDGGMFKQLTRALEESNEVKRVVMPNFVQKAPPPDGGTNVDRDPFSEERGPRGDAPPAGLHLVPKTGTHDA